MFDMHANRASIENRLVICTNGFIATKCFDHFVDSVDFFFFNSKTVKMRTSWIHLFLLVVRIFLAQADVERKEY